jgi:NlpA lipoprotein
MFGAEWGKCRSPRAANMNFHFIDFTLRSSEYDSNHCRSCARPRIRQLIAIRTADKDKPRVRILVDSYHTPEVEEFVLTKFKGAVLPSW